MRHQRFSIAALALAALTTGCHPVGPDFTPPDAPAATTYVPSAEQQVADADSTAQKQTVTLGEKVTADWWTLFHSPEIDTLVKQAIAGNHNLESAKARLTQAHQAIIAASSPLYPQVGVNGSITRERLNSSTFGLPPGTFPLPPNFNLYQVGATASYQVPTFGGTTRAIERETALEDVQRYQLDAAYLTLTGNSVFQAVQIAATRAQIKAVDDILGVDRQNLGLVDQQHSAGTVPDSDVIRARNQLAADETLKPGLDQQVSVSSHALAVLLGQAPGNWSPPDLNLDSLTLPGELPVSLPSELVHQRPDILAAEAELHAASAQIGVATAQLYPSVTLTGSIGEAALNPGHLFDPASLIWSIAAGITQPVFDGGKREAERQAALADFKAAAADYQQTVLEAFGQVADILQALTHDAQLLAAQQRALDTASQAMKLQRLRYSEGASTLLDLLDSQRQYQQARLGYVQAEAQRYKDTVQLLVAMGGGWWGADLAAN